MRTRQKHKKEKMQMRRLVSVLFMLMAGAVFADTVPVAALEERLDSGHFWMSWGM